MASGHSETTNNSAQPVLCGNGCGFYSNVGTGGLCSKCYREQQATAGKVQSALLELKQQAPACQAPPPPPPPAPAAPAEPAAASVAAAAPSEASAAASALVASAGAPSAASPAPPAKQPSPTRCWTCNKKVGFTGFSCKCMSDAVFCSQHRYAEAHECTFDWKAAQRAQLAESNPLVQAAKLQKL